VNVSISKIDSLRGRVWLAGILAFAIPNQTSASAAKSDCERLAALFADKASLVRLHLREDSLEDGRSRIADLDLDGDNRPDEILVSRPGSGSVIPADDSAIAVAFSSSGKTIRLAAQRLVLFRDGGRVLLIDSILQASGSSQSKVRTIQPDGFRNVCTIGCNKKGKCSPASKR